MTTQSKFVVELHVVEGKELYAAAVNSHRARAAAGITMGLGAVAFVYAASPSPAVGFGQAQAIPLDSRVGHGTGDDRHHEQRHPRRTAEVDLPDLPDTGWMEAVLGLCLGCDIYGVMVRRGWRAPDHGFAIRANGACDVGAGVSRP